MARQRPQSRIRPASPLSPMQASLELSGYSRGECSFSFVSSVSSVSCVPPSPEQKN